MALSMWSFISIRPSEKDSLIQKGVQTCYENNIFWYVLVYNINKTDFVLSYTYTIMTYERTSMYITSFGSVPKGHFIYPILH